MAKPDYLRLARDFEQANLTSARMILSNPRRALQGCGVPVDTLSTQDIEASLIVRWARRVVGHIRYAKCVSGML